jgi:hypothetical protein
MFVALSPGRLFQGGRAMRSPGNKSPAPNTRRAVPKSPRAPGLVVGDQQ